MRKDFCNFLYAKGLFHLPERSFFCTKNCAYAPIIIMADAIIIFIVINMPYVDEITEFRSSSKSHNNDGPVTMTIPNATMKITENCGKDAMAVFGESINAGNKQYARKITPPIHTAATKLCI